MSLSVRMGEILGIGGLVGAGRSELVEGIFGIHPLSEGEIFIRGKKVNVKSPRDIIKEGVALITEDRKVTGLNLSGTVGDNIAMVAIKKLLSGGLYDKNKAHKASQEYVEKLNIKTPSVNQIVGNLSGGNQQKIVIAKWLLNDPDIIYRHSRSNARTGRPAVDRCKKARPLPNTGRERALSFVVRAAARTSAGAMQTGI